MLSYSPEADDNENSQICGCFTLATNSYNPAIL